MSSLLWFVILHVLTLRYSINATVLGSKNAEDDSAESGEPKGEEEVSQQAEDEAEKVATADEPVEA